MRTSLYVDAFNLYYGIMKAKRRGDPDPVGRKWLNLADLAQRIAPTDNIIEIHYCSAKVRGTRRDPDKHIRQEVYFRALRTIPILKITLGRYAHRKKFMTCTAPPHNSVEVFYTEEKGSDVNLAMHLLWDGFRDRYDRAIVLSNDSDLAGPVGLVVNQLGKRVTVVNPHQGRHSHNLQTAASDMRWLRPAAVNACQFSDVMRDHKGSFNKPPAW